MVISLIETGADGILGTVHDVIVFTTTTTSDGSYHFSGVTPGREKVVEDDPSGAVNKTAAKGTKSARKTASEGTDP